MRIIEKTKLIGMTRAIETWSLLDTGADISFIPIRILQAIGAHDLNRVISIKDSHGYVRRHFIYKIGLYFPTLNNQGNYFDVAGCDSNGCLIGHDVMGALRIEPHPETGKASASNNVEQFILGGLVLVGGGYITSKLPNIYDWILKTLTKA